MKQRISLAALMASASLPIVATAQDIREEAVLSPITVTAEKRTTHSHDVPASLAVEQGEELAQRKTTRREDALSALPNVQTGAVTARLYTSYTAIRGVGSSLIESDPSVGLYLDGTGIGSTQAYSGTLLDADRVEVLRGPQGTLYGRNNLAGSVNVISNRPDPSKLGGQLNLDYGKHDSGTLSGVLNLPLGQSTWAARVALQTSRTGSPLSSSITGRELNNGSDRHGRFSILGNITDKLEFLGTVESERHTLNNEMFGMPEQDFHAGSKQVAITDPSRISSEMTTSAAQFTYHLDNGAKLVSHTSYLHSKVDVAGNGFPKGYFAAYDAMFQSFGFPDFSYRSGNPYDGHYTQWSQELRYVSDTTQRFNWITGLYGESSEATRAYGANSSFTGGEATLGSKGKTNTSQWKTFGGVRIGRDKKDFDYQFHANPTAVALGLTSSFAPDYKASFSHNYITPRIGVQFSPDKQLNLYASISSGYKSGGFNSGFVGNNDEGAYDSERVTNYEVGFKSLLMNDRVGIEGALFYIDWRNQQVQGYNALTGNTPLVNAPRSRSYGAELSARVQIDKHWSLRAGVGYTDAIYKDFTNARALNGSGTVNVSGNQQQFASRLTGNIGTEYQWLTGFANLKGKAGFQYQFRSAYYFDVQNTMRQPGYGLLSAYVGVEDDRYSAFLYAKNIANKRYSTSAGNLGGGTLVNVGEPLMIGASIGIKF
jgi:iron complex outermembrane receptor protein